MAEVLDVRRFTALDMFGTAGMVRRRRLVRAEFVLACLMLLVPFTVGAAAAAQVVQRRIG